MRCQPLRRALAISRKRGYMKSKILCLFMLGIHSTAFAATSYEIYATVTEPESKLVFPAFKVSATDQSGTSFVDGCTYVGKLTEQNENSVQLEAIMSCSRDEADYQMDMPIFILSSKGQSASYELVEDEAVMWKYDIEIKPIP
ncbi:hypothetical protein EYU44_18465 [Vibrio cholerae]|nr:hypothetical protein [Vibrio cholerae]